MQSLWLSDAYLDDLVALMLSHFPQQGGCQLGDLLEDLLHLTLREVRQAVAEERRRQLARMDPHPQ